MPGDGRKQGERWEAVALCGTIGGRWWEGKRCDGSRPEVGRAFGPALRVSALKILYRQQSRELFVLRVGEARLSWHLLKPNEGSNGSLQACMQ